MGGAIGKVVDASTCFASYNSHRIYNPESSKGNSAMECVSVAARPRARVAILRQLHIAPLIVVGLALGSIACSSQTGVPTSPSDRATDGAASPPTGTTDLGFIDGTVRDVNGILAGVLVEVTGTPGGSATTSTAGLFSFKLPVGTTRLRSSKTGYYPRENDVIVKAGARSSVDILLEKTQASQPFPQPPYTVTGHITDARGTGLAGAEVWIYGQSSPIDNRYATGWTDASGRYSLASPQRVPQDVRAMKDGYLPRDVSILGAPDGPSTWTVNVVLTHIDRYALLPLPPLPVGQSARIEARVDLDDGSSKSAWFQTLTSSDPSVLHVEPNGYVIGVAPGAATLTATYYGATATLQVRVSVSE